MNNRLCRVLGVEKPIIQGPMAWISTAPLVAAVGEAGGLGVLGTGAAMPDFIRTQVAKTRELTDRPFAVSRRDGAVALHVVLLQNRNHLLRLLRIDAQKFLLRRQRAGVLIHAKRIPFGALPSEVLSPPSALSKLTRSAPFSSFAARKSGPRLTIFFP